MDTPTQLPTHSGCPSISRLAAFNIGDLPEAEEIYIAHHIEQCQRCLDRLETIQQQANEEGFDVGFRQAVGQAPVAPTGDSVTRSAATPHDLTSTRVAGSGKVPPSGLIGKMIDAYRVVADLGVGGMGVVVLAEHAEAKHRVAIKMLRYRVAPHPILVERFHKECAALVRLAEKNHPNIVRLLHVGRYEDAPYFAMEYMEGITLAKQLKRDRMSTQGAVKCVRLLAEAVAVAHAAQVLHRDLKPSNVFIDKHGTLKLADFGLAKLLDDDNNPNAPTVTNDVLGTPAYMAPELARGQSKLADERTDVYGLGAILYECLTGKPPFTGPDPMAIREKVCKRRPIPPSDVVPSIPMALESICLKCLEKDPNRRYPTATALAADLTRWLEQGTSAATPTRSERLLRRGKRLLLPLSAVFAAIILTGALHFTDPARPIEKINRQLARGAAVTLLAADSPKPWYRIRAGEAGSKIIVNDDQSLSVLSWDGMTIVELAPSMPTDRYRFAAEIRHERSDENGFVGLYAAHHRYPGATPEGHQFFYALTYNDVRSLKDDLVGKFPPHIAAKMVFPTANNVRQGIAGTGTYANGNRWDTIPREATSIAFQPNGVAGDRWRRLAINVQPKFMFGEWDVQATPRFQVTRYNELILSWRDAQQPFARDDPFFPAVTGEYASRGGIGIVVYHGAATFRGVTLTPQETITPD